MADRIGFSTGALALGDFREALRLLEGHSVTAIELSALRDRELSPLLQALPTLPLAGYSYISVHAPSRFEALSEAEVVGLLQSFVPADWPIIVHPDVLGEPALWRELGRRLCIENMDKRKPIGRTLRELEPVFATYPEASFCFDIGHAHQVDPSMTEAALQLRAYRGRLRQIHVSEVNSRSGHDPISSTALSAFRRVANLVPPGVPLILETIISEDRIDSQLALAARAFAPISPLPV